MEQKPLRTKQQQKKPVPAYHDDTLIGPAPVLKKNSSLPSLNTTTTFPPIIPRAPRASQQPGSQQEMERSLAGVGPQGKDKDAPIGFYDGLCMALGIQTKSTKAKLTNHEERTNKNTVKQLNESLAQIIRKKEFQVREAQKAAYEMEATQLQLAKFRASTSASNDHPSVLTYISMWNHHSQQFKAAQREKAILEQREQETRAYLENYTAEEYQNQIQEIILAHHTSAKSFSNQLKKKQQNLNQVNEITQRQQMYREQSNSLAPRLPPIDEVSELSDDIQKMLARCDIMTSSIKANGYQKPPSPPPPPFAYPDQNFLLRESEDDENQANTHAAEESSEEQ